MNKKTTRFLSVAMASALTLSVLAANVGAMVGAEPTEGDVTVTSVAEKAIRQNQIFSAPVEGIVAVDRETAPYSAITIKNDTTHVQFNVQDDANVPVYSIIKGDFITLSDIKKGDTLNVICDANVAMTRSIPGQVSNIKMMIVGSEISASTVDTFKKMENGAYISSFATLVLHANEDTKIIGMDKTTDVKDFEGKEVAVFYSIATFSLPPQANPELIVVLGDAMDVPALPATPIMAPLRAEAEKLGFDVVWVAQGEQIILTKEDAAITYTLSIGSDMAGHNKSLVKLDSAPTLENDITYVPATFIELMKQK